MRMKIIKAKYTSATTTPHAQSLMSHDLPELPSPHSRRGISEPLATLQIS
jgi:hypothetical protein